MKVRPSLRYACALALLGTAPLWAMAPALGQPVAHAAESRAERGPDDPGPPPPDLGGPTVPEPHVPDRKHNHRSVRLGTVEPAKYPTSPLPAVVRASSEDEKKKRLKSLAAEKGKEAGAKPAR